MNLRNTPTREFDFILLLSAFGLTVYGALLIYSGSLTTYGSPSQALSHPVSRQIVFAAIGLGAMLVLSRFDYRAFGPLSLTLYAVSIAALLFVLVVGASAYGSRRWIVIFGTQVQPSEIAKVATVIMLAKYFSDNEENMRSLRVFLTSMAIAFVPAALVLVEPDLGSALVFGVMWGVFHFTPSSISPLLKEECLFPSMPILPRRLHILEPLVWIERFKKGLFQDFTMSLE